MSCSLVAVEVHAESEHTASRISTASKNSTKDDFVTKFPLKNIAELLDVEEVKKMEYTNHNIHL